MKKSFILLTCFCLIAGIVSAQTRPANTNNSAAAKNKAALDTVQYSLGVYLMEQVLKSGYKIDNPTLFKKAVDDVLQKRPLMVSSAKAQAWLATYQQVYALDKGKQLESMIFSQARNQPGMVALPSGVNYKIVTPGQGSRPSLKDTLILNVNGTLPDGTVFQDSRTGSLIALGTDLVPGLREVVQLMPEGSIWRVIIPASMAYGDLGNGTNIPPHSALIFDIAMAAIRRAR